MKYLMVLFLFLTSCGFERDIVHERVEVQVPVPVTPEPIDEVKKLVNDFNEVRTTQGLSPITSGLSCTLYTVPTTTTSIATASKTTIGSYLYKGTFNQPNSNVNDGLNVLPTSLRSVYKTWYVLRCTGHIVIKETGWHDFSISSDDGSKLVVGGLTLNNDGLHGSVS